MAKYEFTATVVVDTTTKDVDVKMDGECLTRTGGVTTQHERNHFECFLLTLFLYRSKLAELDDIEELISHTKKIYHLDEVKGRKKLYAANAEVLLENLGKEDFAWCEANEGFA